MKAAARLNPQSRSGKLRHGGHQVDADFASNWSRVGDAELMRGAYPLLLAFDRLAGPSG